MIDPITLEVIRNKMIAAAMDVSLTMRRTAYTPLLQEIVDFGCGVFDADANIIAEASAIPIHPEALRYSIKDTYAVIGRENIEPGDVIFCNDSYCGGGTHLPDMTTICPVFYDNELRAWSAFRGHTPDVGGKSAGSWFMDSTDIYQEGLRVPPVKIVEKGKPQEGIFRIIKSNSRISDLIAGDVRAMVAAVITSAKSVQKTIEKYGVETFFECIEELYNHGERIARAAVRTIPEGTYKGEVILDGDGTDQNPLDEKVDVKVTVKVKGDSMHVDMTGSSPQVRGPKNCPMPCSMSGATIGFKAVTTPTFPNNQGCFRPLSVTLPPHSVVYPDPPAAVAQFASINAAIPEAMWKALAPAIPDKIWASSYGFCPVMFVFGTDRRTNKFFVILDPGQGGYGAKPYEDGENALINIICGDTSNMPVEQEEYSFPVRIDKFELVQDSGGPGKWRGGLSSRRDYFITDLIRDPSTTSNVDRTKFTLPYGLFGGKNGMPGCNEVHRKDGTVQQTYLTTDLALKNGETVVMMPGGGGGYGDPLERDPELVLRDVQEEKVSIKSAKQDYGVVIDQKTLQTDYEATKKLRAQLRKSKQLEKPR